MFDIPTDARFYFCVPLGYPQGHFGPNVRKPTSETTFLNRWNGPAAAEKTRNGEESE